MWLFTRFGFFSCVNEGTEMIVRSRSRKHLEALQDRWQDLRHHPIEVNAGTDYKYRMRIGMGRWVSLAADLASDVDYQNFKSKVGTKDAAYAKALMGVWTLMRNLQAAKT